MKLNRYHKIALVALLAAQNYLAIADTAPTTNTTLTATAPATATSKFTPPDYSLLPGQIAKLNIFDPNRRPNTGSVRPPPPTNRTFVPIPTPPIPASFSLVGIIGYGQGSQAGTYVFFDGSGQQYHKTAKLNASIATFRVADIAADSVTLQSGTNKLVLGIGEQLQQDSSGRWNFAPGASPRYDTTGGYSRNTSRNAGYNNYNTGGGNTRRGAGNFGGGGNYPAGGGGYNTGGGGYNTGAGGGYNTGGGNNFRGRNNLQPDQAGPDNTQTIDATMPNIILLNPGDVVPADNADQ